MPRNIVLKIVCPFICILAAPKVLSLDLDEKLTIRFLKVSQSKKTILINRGLEDGLVIGDHAKFFVTEGVIARGVVVKASPGRSIWSIYRIIDGNELTDNKVLNLKISTPVKLTEDPSKSLILSAPDNEVLTGKSAPDQLKIPLAEGANDLATPLSKEENEEIKDLGGNGEEFSDNNESKIKTHSKTLPTEKNKGSEGKKEYEIFSNISFTSLSGTTTNSTKGSTEANTISYELSLGVEKYFPKIHSADSILGNFSVLGFIRKKNQEVSQSHAVGFDTFDYGAGFHYHFFQEVFFMQTPVYFVGFQFGKGSVTHTNQWSNSSSTDEQSTNSTGSSLFYALNFGIKYAFNTHWSARAQGEFFIQKITLDGVAETNNGENIEISQSGPKVYFGMSYAF